MNHANPGLGPHGDIVLSSRVRVARNLESYQFPHIINHQDAQKISNLVLKHA